MLNWTQLQYERRKSSVPWRDLKMLILYKHFRVLKSFSSVQRVLRPQSWRNSTMNGAYVNLDGQATQWLWAVMSLICLNTVMFVRMLLSILHFRHHLHLYPVQAAFAEMLCPGSVMTLSVCLQPSEVQSAGGKPRVERSETFFGPCILHSHSHHSSAVALWLHCPWWHLPVIFTEKQIPS